MTLLELLQDGAKHLEAAGIAEAELDARYLLFEAFHIDFTRFLTDRMRQMPETEENLQNQKLYQSMIEKRSSRIPLQYITGSQEFMGLGFYVDENVLIPRQDTETLVELVMAEHPKEKAAQESLLDMCTGSGCIAISLKKLGGFGQVTAVDISQGALNVAKKNAENLGAEIRFVESNLFQNLTQEEAENRFDVIVSNPPYIPTEVVKGLEPEVKDHEPVLALDGTEDGLLFYRELAKNCGHYLKPQGTVYFEIGYDQGQAVSELLAEAGYEEIEVVKDMPGLDRVVKARLK